ncbi:MAG TPA: hypothetical protein VFB38_05670 [Chthonomonadaceae bacterium]|nr:hypothetical protein [Chthonomonadaceae bacterium]
MAINFIVTAATLAMLISMPGQNSVTHPKFSQDAALQPRPLMIHRGKDLSQDAALQPRSSIASQGKSLSQDSAVLQGISSVEAMRGQLARPAPGNDLDGAYANEQIMRPLIEEAMRRQLETGDYTHLETGQ